MTEKKTTGATRLPRRAVLKGALVGSAAVAVSGFPAITKAKPSRLVVATGGGKLEEAYKASNFKAFTENTAIPIVTTPNPTAKLKAMVEQNAVEWDVMQLAAEHAAVLARQGLLEPIDYSIVDKSTMLPGTATEYYVLTDIAAYHIAWNTNNVPAGKAPADWAAFWAIDGRKGLWKKPFQTMEAALMADGVSPDALYPLDVERALKKFGQIKNDLIWWTRGAQSAQILIDGEVEVSSTWNGRVHQPKLSGAPVDYHFNQAVLVNDAYVVPRGAPNKRESMQLLATTLDPKVQAAYSRIIPYAPTNTAALKYLDDSIKKNLPSADKGVMLDVNYWAEHGEENAEKFNEFLLS